MEVSVSFQEPATGEHPLVPPDGSFAQFYVRHHDEVARALALSLGDTELGIEAADEAMTRACQRWTEVATYGNPQGWVYRVGLNWARSFLRRRRRIRPSEYLHEQGVLDPAPADPLLAQALAALDHKHRSVVVLRFYLDWSIEATADALDIAPGTVKSRLSRALSQLQTRLADRPTDPHQEASNVIDLRRRQRRTNTSRQGDILPPSAKPTEHP